MSKVTRISETPRTFQWKTDGSACVGIALGGYSSLLVEVRGDLQGKPVVFLGGMTEGAAEELAFLDEVSSPGIVTLPAVAFLLPVTEAVGVTITFRGLP
jgi:hypothetical protein